MSEKKPYKSTKKPTNNPNKKATNNPNKKPSINKNKPTKVFTYRDGMIVSDVARELNLNNAVIIKKLINLGIMANVNQALERDVVELLVLETDYEFKEEVIIEEVKIEDIKIIDDEKDLVSRPPIVTVIVYVDQG